MSIARHSRDALVQGLLALSTPNLSDALDRLELSGAPHGFQAVWPGAPKFVGRAATMKLVAAGATAVSPVLGTLEAIVAARAGDVLVIDHGGRIDVNSFGGVAAFTSVTRGLVGAVIDGATRDVEELRELGFPVFARGVIQQSIRNRCAFGGAGLEVELGGVRVRPGDFVAADENGVVVIPAERAQAVLELAREFLATEEQVKDAIAGGLDPVRAHEQVRYDRMTARGEG